MSNDDPYSRVLDVLAGDPLPGANQHVPILVGTASAAPTSAEGVPGL